MISVNSVSVVFSGNYLFDNISFLINEKHRIGLVGKNGAGKTTLLKLINGELEAESGEIVIPSNISIGYLPQEKIIDSSKNIYEETLSAFDEIKKLEHSIELLNIEISDRVDYESKDYLKKIDKLTVLNERYQLLGGISAQADTEKVLKGLGFTQSDFSRPISEFSNGWQMRVELAKLLLRRPECLLLDEPTNHLDIESIQWLEDFLINYHGSIVLVSHDRTFLDTVSNRTVEIELGKIYDYKTSYSHYVTLREERLAQQTATYNNQQKQIKQIERFVERFRYKDSKAKQVQSKIKSLKKIDEIEIENIDESAIHFKFPPVPPSGKIVMETINLSKAYGNLEVLNEIDFIALKGEKIAFVGKNGEGKTTLAKILVNDLDYNSGEVKPGHNVKIGYYSQNQWEMLNPDITVFETIDEVAVGDIRTKIRGLLGSFMFSGETIDKKVKVLSGGEKARLSLAKLLLKPVNLLILDEPTNHLDMRSKDILKSALLMYEGAMIIVSHDRDFMQGLTTKVIEFKNQSIKEHLGDIYNFLDKKKIETLKEMEKAKKKASDSLPEKISENKQNYERKKRLDKDLRKIANQIKSTESEIEKIETLISEMDQKLAKPDQYAKEISSGELYKQYDIMKKKHEIIMNKWEELQLKEEETKELY